jgi:uncharacterized RDD family membrane protein YckC
MTNPYAPPMAAVLDIADPSVVRVRADRSTRLGAAILDTLVFMAMVYVPFLVVAMTAGAAGLVSQETGGGALIGVAAFAASLGFGLWCWLTIRYMRRNGQSIAKKWVGLKIVRADGSAASVARTFWVRTMINWALSILPLYGLIDVLFIFGGSRQCLHDKFADTMVIKA